MRGKIVKIVSGGQTGKASFLGAKTVKCSCFKVSVKPACSIASAKY